MTEIGTPENIVCRRCNKRLNYVAYFRGTTPYCPSCVRKGNLKIPAFDMVRNWAGEKRWKRREKIDDQRD